MRGTTYGYVIRHCGMYHVFEYKDDMDMFVRTFDVDVESDYSKPLRCEIHHFDEAACKLTFTDGTGCEVASYESR